MKRVTYNLPSATSKKVMPSKVANRTLRGMTSLPKSCFWSACRLGKWRMCTVLFQVPIAAMWLLCLLLSKGEMLRQAISTGSLRWPCSSSTPSLIPNKTRFPSPLASKICSPGG